MKCPLKTNKEIYKIVKQVDQVGQRNYESSSFGECEGHECMSYYNGKCKNPNVIDLSEYHPVR